MCHIIVKKKNRIVALSNLRYNKKEFKRKQIKVYPSLKLSQETERNMKPYSDNSFFHQNYEKLKVLLFVPHQDDEINTAGTLLYSLAQCKAQITLVYATNGDWENPAEVRFTEAIKAAGILGIPEEDIFFMGYGDTLNSNDNSHVFYHKNTVARSPAGYTETYGTHDHPDFAFFVRKAASQLYQ